ncbi:hypothetical protein APHAL10511_000892 [Amanita phalloides]|nr:hypothetical protein APHAL10511_000892 [Amanita phalloides]
MSKQEAINKLEQAGIKPEFAAKVVEHSGVDPSEILNNPAKVLEEYWYDNVDVDFLDGAVAVNVEELKRGLIALQFQDSIVNEACKRPPSDEFIGHRDIFIWGLIIVRNHGL